MESMNGEEPIVERMNGPSSMEAAGTACTQVDLELTAGKHQSTRGHVASCPVARYSVHTNRR